MHSLLQVKVAPGASREAILGWLGEALKVSVSAPPDKGRANDAVVALIAARLGLPRRAVSIASGLASTRKQLRIEGLTADEVRRRLTD
jgi:uncharacterized protein (TIGR00251 family)